MLRLCLIFLAALAGTTATVVRREASCEQLLTSVVDDPNKFCEQLRETLSKMKSAIRDVEAKVRHFLGLGEV